MWRCPRSRKAATPGREERAAAAAGCDGSDSSSDESEDDTRPVYIHSARLLEACALHPQHHDKCRARRPRPDRPAAAEAAAVLAEARGAAQREAVTAGRFARRQRLGTGKRRRLPVGEEAEEQGEAVVAAEAAAEAAALLAARQPRPYGSAYL